MVFREFLQLLGVLFGRQRILISQSDYDNLPRDLQRHFQPEPEAKK